MGQNPTPEARRGPQNPVENAFWADIVEFCRRVSERTGRTVRLPTGAEFEYAARVGTSDACFPDKYRDQESDIGNKTSQAVPVKTKEPNAWGLYDMLTYYGWHACSDYDAENPTGKQVDPQGPIPGKDPIYFPGAHRALGGDQYGVRPNIHYWYFEGPKPEADGHWVGIFRVAVEP
jgi:formylglycine-generating enzyme required for sulfatase activity